jgi:hypothetical protein
VPAPEKLVTVVLAREPPTGVRAKAATAWGTAAFPAAVGLVISAPSVAPPEAQAGIAREPAVHAVLRALVAEAGAGVAAAEAGGGEKSHE